MDKKPTKAEIKKLESQGWKLADLETMLFEKDGRRQWYHEIVGTPPSQEPTKNIKSKYTPVPQNPWLELQYNLFLKNYAESNSLDYDELVKKSNYFKSELLDIFAKQRKDTKIIYDEFLDKKELPTEDYINKIKQVDPNIDEELFKIKIIRDPAVREEMEQRFFEIRTRATNEANLILNKILLDLAEVSDKPYSVNLQHIFTGKPRSVKVDEKKVQRALKRITHEIYESGELFIESGNESFPAKLRPFIHKLIDYCIVTMTDNGSVYSLTDGSVFKYFKLGHGGPQRSKVKTAIDWLTKTKLKFNIKLQLSDYGPDGVTVTAQVPDPETLLKPLIVSYETVGGDSGKRISHYQMPSFFIDLKLNRRYLVYRDYEFFGLPDDEYEMLISIHGKLRQSPFYEKGEYAVNLKDFTEKGTSVHTLTRNAKKVISTIHSKLDHLVKNGGIKKYYITERGNKTVLSKTWYQNPKYKLTKYVDGKILPNYDLFENMIYHFVGTDKFIKDHKNIRDKRQRIEEEKSIPLDL